MIFAYQQESIGVWQCLLYPSLGSGQTFPYAAWKKVPWANFSYRQQPKAFFCSLQWCCFLMLIDIFSTSCTAFCLLVHGLGLWVVQVEMEAPSFTISSVPRAWEHACSSSTAQLAENEAAGGEKSLPNAEWGVNNKTCAARWFSGRQKPWELFLWRKSGNMKEWWLMLGVWQTYKQIPAKSLFQVNHCHRY